LQSTPAVFYGNIFITHRSGIKVLENKKAGKSMRSVILKERVPEVQNLTWHLKSICSLSFLRRLSDFWFRSLRYLPKCR